MEELTKEERDTIKSALARIGCENLTSDIDFSELLGTPYMDFFKYLPTVMQVLGETDTKEIRHFVESLKRVCIVLSAVNENECVLSDIECLCRNLSQAKQN